MRLILIALLSSTLTTAQSVSPIDLQWRDYETTCNATFIIEGFHNYIAEGAAFQTKAKVLEADLQKFTTVTCPKNIEAVNGDRSYDAIVPEFARLSTNSVTLRDVAQKEAEYLTHAYNSMGGDLQRLHMDFPGMHCADAMRGSLNEIQHEAALILKKYREMKSCPALAKLESVQKATAGARTTSEKSGAAPVPGGNSRSGASDITGTKKVDPKVP